MLNKSIQFLLLPLYTRLLVPADYGKLELIYMVGAILAIINGFLIQNAYARFFFDKSIMPNFREQLYSSSLFFMLFCSLITLLFSFTFSEDIASLFFNFNDGGLYVRLVTVSSLLMAISAVPNKTLIVQEKPKIYSVISIVNTLSTISFTIYFLVILNWNIEGVLWGQIIGRSIGLILTFVATFKNITLKFSFRMIKNMLMFSAFLIPTQLSSFVTYFSNRLFLQEYNSLDDVGVFSLAYKIAAIIPLLITGPTKKALTPYIYADIGKPDECKRKLRNINRLFLLLLLSLSLILSLFSKELLIIMSDKTYIEAYHLVFPLSMSYVLIGMAGVVVIGINIVKKTWVIMFTWLVASIINLLANSFLVPVYGKLGASYATLITFLIILILYLFFVEKYYRVGFEYLIYFQMLALTILIYFCSECVNLSLICLFLFKVVLVIVFFIISANLFFKKSEKIDLDNTLREYKMKFSHQLYCIKEKLKIFI
jgi:O-antigen/teichoic acid export membrane protein